MTDDLRLPSTSSPDLPGGGDLLTGNRLLRRAFLDTPLKIAHRDAVIVGKGDPQLPAILINRGVAYSAFTRADGRRAIVDILLPGDIVGMENAVMGRSNHEIIAASSFGYRLLTGPTLIELMSNPAVSLRALALVGETLWRLDQHLTAVMRFDARGRICLFLLGIYDRLRRRNLVARPTFNLPLTQEQMADHLGMTIVHIGRTLRRLREEELVLVDRQVVIILDLDQLRRSVGDAPSFAFPETESAGQSAEPIQPAE